MTFRRTQNEKLIHAIATHPQIWPTMADDITSDPALWKPVLHAGIWYVLCFGDERETDPRGMLVFFPENSITWQVHLCILPDFWGSAARTLREAFQWLWAQTACLRITGSVPVWNAPAVHCALRAGMQPFGVNLHSSLKGGRLHHQLLVGISKPAERVA
jgi:RimJ/RimL family protein N-acetyltransferase